jgi:hypothetical protein
MAVTDMNRLPDAGLSFMRQALVEARLMSEKRACDAVYVATLAEELRNVEKKIAALEEAYRSAVDQSTSQVLSVPSPEDLPDAEWIRQKARELGLRLHRVEQASKPERIARATGATRVTTVWRAVPRYPKTQGGKANRNAYKSESKI